MLDVVLDLDDGFFGEQVVPKFFVEVHIVAPEPFEGHRGVLDFLAGIVPKDLRQFPKAHAPIMAFMGAGKALAIFGALSIPIDSVEFFHHTQNCVMFRNGEWREVRRIDVKS